MIRIDVTADIGRPPEEVFAYLSQNERETEWQEGLVESRLTSPGPIGVGSTGRDVRKFMGREFVTTWQVTEYVPPKSMKFRIVTGPMPFEGTMRLEPVGGGTRLIYAVEAHTRGAARLLDPLTKRLVRTQFAKQMTGLKRVLENA